MAGERSLDRFYKLPKEQVRKLQELEGFTGVKALEDIRKVTAWKYLKDIEGKLVEPSILESRLKSLGDPSKYVNREEYKKLMGKDLFDDLEAHFANRDFNLTTSVPGTGGGVYPGPSGIKRVGISQAAKKYYKDIKPGMEKIKRKVSPLIEEGRKKIYEIYAK